MTLDSRLPITQSAIERVTERFGITLREWVQILSCYTTEARLRLVLRLLLVERSSPEMEATHKELAELMCSSREKVTRAIVALRAKGVLKKKPGWNVRSIVVLGAVAP